ncbi:MAG: IS1634 family transposase [Euryarchaeota archaeon]|nr:IS1634 family transposase [Euryarchaeota archaeon]MDE1881887.1 IS1634 family transposase [Euryarchaeota archaeon]MDE2046667.1 IS1634 family transposase [Thermoplasmata archaeon]
MDLRFFLKLIESKGRKYAYLARSVRRGDKVETEILVKFGVVTDEQLERLRKWIITDPTLPPEPQNLLTDLSHLVIRESWEYGVEALGHFLWWKLGLHRIVLEALNRSPNKARDERLLEMMVLNRVVDPMSKWALLTDWLEDSSAPFLTGLRVEPLHDNHFYRAMDRLWARQDTLEAKVWREVVRPHTAHPELFFHDNTSTWFEGTHAELGGYSGYAPDHRTDRPRVKWGVVATEDGWPVTLAIFPGETKDDQTPKAIRDRLTRVLGVRGGVYIGDRGMKNDKEATPDLEKHKFRWILAMRNDEHEDVLIAAQKAPIVAVSLKNEVREVLLDRGRFVVLLNEERRKEMLETLERRLAEGRAIIAEQRRRVGKAGHHAILKACQEALTKAHLTNLFDIDWDEGTVATLLARMKETVAFRKRWAGWWVLRTNTELPAEEVARQYLQLARTEELHAVVKGPLSVRPLHHRLEERVGAHLLICHLAALLVKYVERRVKEAGLKDAEGEPLTGVSAFQAFRKVKASEAELPGTGQTRIVITKLKPLQEAILKAVDLETERFLGGWSRLL